MALDRVGDPVLVGLTRLAHSVSGGAGAAVHLFDDRYQHRVAATGIELGSDPAEDSLCRLVVESGQAIITADATGEPDFSYSPYVHGDTPLRFYAGMPLQVHGEVTVGTLCAFGPEPIELNAEQVERLSDIAGIVRAHLELVEIATTLGREASLDGLTGALTRVIFDDHVARALARHRESGERILVSLIDIDAFKEINDTHGHAVGDTALVTLTERLLGLTEPGDVVGRLGGDEFGLLSHRPTPALEEELVSLAGARLGADPLFTVSIGSTFARAGDDVGALLRRADAEMYAVKARKPGHRTRPETLARA
jgi:diguanylate cyclase (GGDEF)-like protein